MRGLSPVAASGGHSSSRCAGLSVSRPLSLRSTGSRRAGSAIVAHGPSRSTARGILPDQGPNPRPLHWQADSQPLRHQGSPKCSIFKTTCGGRWKVDTVQQCGMEVIVGQVKRTTTNHTKGQSSTKECDVLYMVGLEGSPLL